MSKFEKDQIVRDHLTRYRVESGPHMAGSSTDGREERYLLEIIFGPDKGHYRWHPASQLVSSPPAPTPKVGDRGDLVGYGFGPYRLVYLDSRQAILIDGDGDGKILNRSHFNDAWRPQS